MYNLPSKFLLGSLLCLLLPSLVVPARAQNFGSSMGRKKLVLQRKLPPTGHIDGTTIKVVAVAKGFQADIGPDLASTLEALLIRNDSRLRSEDTHPDTLVNCQVTTYAQPPAQTTMQPGIQIGKTPAKATPLTRVTGILTVSFTAKDTRTSKSIAADTVTAKFDQEYNATGAQQPGFAASFKHLGDQITKGKQEEDKPPTAAELHNRLIQDAAEQIASHLVVTTEHLDVLLAKGGGLDEANKLAEEKLWTRALEQLETMTPFPQKEEDAYRLYNIGVMNEALAYDAEDVKKARTYLQEASIDYGKAIDAKPTEKYFLQPQTRIDTALAHYKTIGEQATVAKAAPVKVEVSAPAPATPATTPVSKPAASSPSPKPPAASAPANALTNDQVIAMVQAKLDQANILDNIRHAGAVSFDLSVDGQVNLSKNGVNGQILMAMKQRARTPAIHH
jgi:cell division septation protein DedD